MSIILDALKKSESDRLKQDTPGFSHVPDKSSDKGASHWIWIVVVLIAINVAVLAVLFLRPSGQPANSGSASRAESGAGASPAAAIRPPVTSRQPAPANVAAPTQAIEEPVAQADAPPANQTREATSGSRSPSPAVAQPAPATRQPVAAPAGSGSAGTGRSGITESYVSFNDLRAQGLLKLPDLHLDIHVFSEQPAGRFVFVNMSKYRERETLDEGPLVSEITPDGVILVYRGITFLLPRE